MSALLVALVAMQATGTIGGERTPVRQDAPVAQSQETLPPQPSPAGPYRSPPANPQIRATPRNAPQNWVTNDDYPAAALRAGESGTVGFTLTIDKTGAVTGCEVTASSGSAALDTAACTLLSQRALFNPARDARNRPVASTWRSRFRWELPTDATPLPASFPVTTMTRVTIASDGTITGCTYAARPENVIDGGCDFFRSRPATRLAGLRGGATGPVTLLVLTEQAVDGRALPPEAVPDGFRLVGARSTTFEIAETGVPENCVFDGMPGECTMGRFLPGPARIRIVITARVWTDGDPNIREALDALHQ